MGLLLYGAGLRLLECARLRIKDVDFASNQIVVRDGKGHKDRVTMLPAAVKAGLAGHLDGVRRQHELDVERGAGGAARRPQAEIPQCGSGVGVAVGLPGDLDLRGSPDRRAAPAPL